MKVLSQELIFLNLEMTATILPNYLKFNILTAKLFLKNIVLVSMVYASLPFYPKKELPELNLETGTSKKYKPLVLNYPLNLLLSYTSLTVNNPNSKKDLTYAKEDSLVPLDSNTEKLKKEDSKPISKNSLLII